MQGPILAPLLTEVIHPLSQLTLTLDTFNQITRTLVDKTLLPVRKALRDEGYADVDLDDGVSVLVPLVGHTLTVPLPEGGALHSLGEGERRAEIDFHFAIEPTTVPALLQVLQPLIDPTFSAHSHGFRPGRSAHGAVREAQQYVQAGRGVVVDVDLEKFFDRVNHDILMDRLAKRIADKRVLRLIRRYLQAGILAHGVQSERFEGTPQGGPLSPLLANVLLDDLDQHVKHRIRERYAFYSQDLINNLFMHPYTKIEFIERDLGVSRLTATKYLDQLGEAGFVQKQKVGRSNYYINLALNRILLGNP